MLRYTLQRILAAIPTLFGVSVLTFAIVQFVPGGPVSAILGMASSNPDAVAEVTAQLGLDRPVVEQYWLWLTKALTGDFGTSTQFRIPVSDLIWPKLQNTLILTSGSLFFAVVFGISAGIVTAIYHRTIFDRLAMFLTLVAASAPVFWTGLLLNYLFALKLGLLPSTGMTSIFTEMNPVIDILWHLILPAFVNSIISFAVIARIVRSDMLEALTQPYLVAAKARGLPGPKVVLHAFRSVLPGAINIAGLQVGFLFGSALFVEVVFAWPGVGNLIYTAIQARDYVTLQATVLIVSAVFVIVNLFADLARIALDPMEQFAN